MQYSSAQFSGYVKEKTTGAPIPGAVVIATWKQSRPKFFHGTLDRLLHVSEAVTDENGKYTLAAWGPKFRRPFWKLDVYDTGSLVFKPGYKFESKVGHNIGDKSEIPPALPSETFLDSVIGNIDAHLIALRIISEDRCCKHEQLTSTPNLILLLDQERRRLARLGIDEFKLRGIVKLENLTAEQRRMLENLKRLLTE